MRGVALLGLVVGCAAGAGASAAEGGNVASGLTITRLGTAAPTGRQRDGGEGTVRFDQVSSAPIVLWSAHGAPAVLTSTLSVRGVYMVGGKVKQSLEVLAGGARGLGGRGSVFPLVNREVETTANRAELIHGVFPADLDGDGEDELIAVYGAGSEGPGTIEVYSDRKRLDAWKGKGRHHRHMLQSLQVARIGGKDVAHLVLERFDDRDEDRKKGRPPHAVLRIDERGISEVKLTGFGFDVEKIGGVGALSRAGSGKLDELIVATQKGGDERGLYFSRHAPDGAILDAPRRTEGSAYYGHWFQFLPGSDTAVSWYVQDRQLYAATPREPKGWITHLDLDRRSPSGGPSDFVGVLDPAGQPKIVTRIGEALFAEDLQGRFVVRGPDGWRAVKKPQPFYTASAPREGQALEDVVLARDGSALLLVHARRRTVKEPSRDLLAETTFTILRDGVAAEQATIPGAPVGGVMDDVPLSDLVHFRPAARGATLVLAMSNGEEPQDSWEKPLPERLHLAKGFYQIDWRPAGDGR